MWKPQKKFKFKSIFENPLWITPMNLEKPPTIYSILQSIVNYGKDDKTKIKNLAEEAHTTIFYSSYPLSTKVDRDSFETNILNHFLMRRIGFDTVTAFSIALDSKLNEIMPRYNLMFNALDNWDIFQDGEITTREGQEKNTNESSEKNTNESSNTLDNESSTESSDTQDQRHSDTPQSLLNNVQDASYVTDYNYNQNTANSSDTSKSTGTSNSETNTNSSSEDDKTYTETVTRTPSDKIEILRKMQEDIKSIYTLIYDDLEVLFYQVEDF